MALADNGHIISVAMTPINERNPRPRARLSVEPVRLFIYENPLSMSCNGDEPKRTGISVGLTLLLATLAVGSAGCPSVILRDVVTTGDAWTLTIRYVTDGPDGYTLNGFPQTYNTPANGDKFYQVVIRLRNDSRARRDFNYDRCDLDAGEKAIVPSFVATAMNYRGDPVESLDPGETISRTLIFSYPRGRAPTRLSCVPMVVPLPPTIPPR